MYKSSMEINRAALSPVLFHHNFCSPNKVLEFHRLISDNETKKVRADCHTAQTLMTANHLTGITYAGGHQNANQLTAGYMTGVPNLGGRQNGDHVAAQYLAGGRGPVTYLNVGNSAKGHAPA